MATKIYEDGTTKELVIDNGSYEKRYPAFSEIERDKAVVNEGLIIKVISTGRTLLSETPFGGLTDSGGTPYASFAALKTALDGYFDASV